MLSLKATHQGGPLYTSRKKSTAAAQRSQDRRQRENDAPRLKDVIPNLTSLRVDVTEHSGTGTTKHGKLVVVASAPSLFVFTCGDKACEEGGYDLTHEIMASLRAGQTRATGECTCGGQTGSAPCTRRIDYEIVAEYA